MEEIKLSNEMFEQMKDFIYWRLTKEKKMLIDKIILNEELKERYKMYGLCKNCKQPNTGRYTYYQTWCQPCNAKRFQQNFKNWTSGNYYIDKLIQKTQLKAVRWEEI